MTIKIDGNRPAGDADGAQRVTTPRQAERSTTGGPAVRGDRLEVSKDAQLMATALKAANDAPAIRQDVVERMRKLLDSGELGADSGRIADALIDHLLDK